jgi:ABC-type transport system involved in cytochrome c biogenesis permease subunit
MDGAQRALERLRPDRVVLVAAGLSVLLPVVAFAWAAGHGPWRGGSMAAAVGAVVIVAVGLYAFRLGAPGRSG